MAQQNLIKRAHSASEFTPELIQELVRCKNDPVYFINNYGGPRAPKPVGEATGIVAPGSVLSRVGVMEAPVNPDHVVLYLAEAID
mgnify:CR=1 FL=1